MSRAFISIDYEGLPHVVSYLHMSPGRPLYGEARRIATLFASRVASRLLERGFGEVVVADSHGVMVNVDPFELPRGVVLVRGFPRVLSMVTGARGCSAALFIGYHGAASTASVLSHTYSISVVHRVVVDGRQVSEYALNAMLLGEWGVPVVLVAGSEELGGEVRSLTPWAVWVPLKRSVGYLAASSPSMEEALEGLLRGVDRAVEALERGEVRPLEPGRGHVFEVEFKLPLYAEAAATLPIVERVDGVRVRFRCEGFEECFRVFESLVLMAYAVKGFAR